VLKIRFAQIEHRIENFSLQIDQSITRIDQLNDQLELTKSSIVDTQKLHVEMKQQMTFAFDNLQQSQQKFSTAEAEYNKSNEEYNQHNIIIARQQSRINEINNERGIRTQQIEDLKLKIVSGEQQLVETQKQLEETNLQLASYEEKLYAALQQKESGEKNLNEKDQAFYNFRNTITEKETALNKKRREKENSEAQLTSVSRIN
jgi:chromosome segregation protein